MGVCVGDTCGPNVSLGVDAAGIDLGHPADAGKNVFLQNAKAGLCLAFVPVAGTLAAAGNTFGAKNCTVGTPTLTADVTCMTKVDVGFPPLAADISACK